ncbi:hypothetical protein [Mesorhizobium sp. B2-1-3]|uniref:hypothetical protein n=1 Tax=Mesorhizobium sp. B2-1-3 TaxID=2589972 RepID=UPI0015E3DB2F|nr:hypothetical protein [Mesorhizobium sp. B2-1-3]
MTISIFSADWRNEILRELATKISDLGAAVHAATSKTTPVDADEFPLADSAASFAVKKVTWANIKATISASLAAVASSGSASDLGTGTLPDARVSATLTADKAFRRGNILATVAQSAGVPTGGLIEAGSNANGDYVRFADGTQICWRTIVTVNTTANAYFIKTELFAATFAAAPRCVVSPITSNVTTITAGYWRANTVSTIAIEFASSVNVISTNTFNCVAVGRWF